MMLPLRIRKAQVAMADGRLDEAYEQAIREDVRDHRKGQRLISRLAKAYEKRAQVHLRAGSAQAAVADADRAARLGGNQPSIVALRDEALAKFSLQQGERQSRQQKIAAAKRCIASGDLALGAQLCKGLEQPGNTVAGIMRDAELTSRLVTSALERGRGAFKSSQWELALDALAEAKRLQPMHAAVIELSGQVKEAILKQIRQSFSQGRLDQAELLLDRLHRHAPECFEVQEFRQVLAKCREAASATATVQLGNAVALLKSLQQIVPEARWLNSVVQEAETAVRSIENLRTGPLGSISSRPVAAAESTLFARQPRSAAPMPVHEMTPRLIPDRFMLHLDGAGSFLVVRKSHVSIGMPSRSRPVDVPLQGPSGVGMTIERVDDDYFLSSIEPVLVNGKETSNVLLGGKDQIRLGRRGSMHFSLPCSASTSATLDFVGVRLAHGNARRVILMDDSIVIGPQPSAHIQTLAMERAMVIHWRDGALNIRPMSRSLEASGALIAFDRPHDVDGLSLVVTGVA